MGFTADIAGIIPLLAAVRSSAVSISATQRRLSSQLECFSASRSILAFLIEEMISSQLMTKQHVCMTVSVINHKALLLIIGWTETKNSLGLEHQEDYFFNPTISCSVIACISSIS